MELVNLFIQNAQSLSEMLAAYSGAVFAAILTIWSRLFGFSDEPPIGSENSSFWLTPAALLCLVSIAAYGLQASLITGYYYELSLGSEFKKACKQLVSKEFLSIYSHLDPVGYFHCDASKAISLWAIVNLVSTLTAIFWLGVWVFWQFFFQRADAGNQ